MHACMYVCMYVYSVYHNNMMFTDAIDVKEIYMN